MKPPTKYENMRMNRAAAECRAAHGPAGAAIPALPDKPAAEPTKPPTMTVDGVEYIETVLGLSWLHQSQPGWLLRFVRRCRQSSVWWHMRRTRRDLRKGLPKCPPHSLPGV